MRLTFIAVILFTLFSCHFRCNNENSSLNPKIKETGFGIWETKKLYTEELNESPTGRKIVSEDFKLIKTTDTIPGKLGQTFGVEYIINANKTKTIDVELVWNFPEVITNNEGKSYKEIRNTYKKPTNQKLYSAYTFDKNFEIVKGQWTFQIYFERSILFEKKFIVE